MGKWLDALKNRETAQNDNFQNPQNLFLNSFEGFEVSLNSQKQLFLIVPFIMIQTCMQLLRSEKLFWSLTKD